MNILHLFSISIIISGSLYPVFALDRPQVCDASTLPHYGPHNPSHIYIKDSHGNMPYIPLTYHTTILHDDDVWNTSTQPRTVQVTLTIQNQDTGQQVFNQTQSLQMKACSGPESVKWRFVPIQIANYIATVSDNRDKEGMIFNSVLDATKSQTVSSPLEQYRAGSSANDVKCREGLQLVIKAEDNSPNCVRPQTAQNLVEREWGWAMQPIYPLKSLLPNRIAGLENDTGIVSLKNQTYYFDTPHYTESAYVNPVQTSFHDVVFTLFPSGFRGGLPTPCDHQGSGQYYWADAKFSDNTHELLHIFSDSPPCNTIPTMFSNHTNPQTGLTFYDGKLKLLVRVEGELQQNNSNKFLVVYKMDIYGLQQNYKIGQPIKVTVNYTGYFNAGFHPDVKILDINNRQVWSSCCLVDSIPLNVLNSTYVYTLENSNGHQLLIKQVPIP